MLHAVHYAVSVATSASRMPAVQASRPGRPWPLRGRRPEAQVAQNLPSLVLEIQPGIWLADMIDLLMEVSPRWLARLNEGETDAQ